MRRGVCVGLAACLFAASSGCRSGAERAADGRDRIGLGMTRDEVESRLGSPDGWEKDVNGYEVWAYAYKPNVPTYVAWRTVDAVGIALVIGVFLGLFWITYGLLGPALERADPLSPTSAPDTRFQRFVFRVGFDLSNGRVAFVSSPIAE